MCLSPDFQQALDRPLPGHLHRPRSIKVTRDRNTVEGDLATPDGSTFTRDESILDPADAQGQPFNHAQRFPGRLKHRIMGLLRALGLWPNAPGPGLDPRWQRSG